MKRSLYLSVIVAMLLAMMIPASALAADVSSYTSGIQVQNLSSTDPATITITFYNRADGSAVTPAFTPDPIPANTSATYYPLTGVGDGFDGSAVIASDQPVAAIVNMIANANEHTAAYGGFSAGATEVYLPLTQKNNYGIDSFVNVQNTGTAAATVNLTYPGTGCSETGVTVQPGAAARFDQSTNTCLSDGPHAAIVSSEQPVAATVVQTQSNNEYLQAAVLAYNGFATQGSTEPIMPLVSSGWYGSVTGIQLQNTGSVSTTVTVSYSPSSGFPGAACQITHPIPAQESVTFGLAESNLLPAECRTDQDNNNAFVGSAVVTSNTGNQPLVAIVNQINSTNPQAAAYSSFSADAGTQTVSLPLLADRNYGIFSGFSVANVGDAAATISCEFTSSTHTESATVDPGGALTATQLDVIADGYVGSATCTSTQPIVAVVNYLDPATVIQTTLDGLSVYEGINR